MFRAPIWITSAASSTASTCRGSISSVTTGSPVSSRASRRIASASSPSPWKVYGDVRGLNAPPRSIVAPASCDRARRLERLLAVLDRARPGDQAEELVADLPPVDLDHGRVGRDLARDELVRLQDRQHLLDPGVALERQRRQQLALADRADHRRLAPARDARVARPASCSRASTCSVWSGVALAPITISSSGDPFVGHRGGKGSCDTERRCASFRDPSLRRARRSATTRAASASTRRRRSRARRSSASSTCTRSRRRSSRGELHEATLDLAAMLFATGLDPDRSTVFVQSHVTAHAEAAWLLGSVTSFGELRRMTQFKEKCDRAGLRLRRPLHLPGADGRRHPALPDRSRPGRRRPAPARRADARRRRALQPALRRDVRRARGLDPRGRRADQEPAGARAADVDDARRAAGRRPAGRPARRRSARSSRPRSPTPARDVRHDPEREAGHLEPDRDHVRRDRRARSPRSRRATTARATAQFKAGRRRGGRRAARPDPGALRGAPRRRAASSARCSPAAPRRPARPRPPRSSRCTSAWASSGPRSTILRRFGTRLSRAWPARTARSVRFGRAGTERIATGRGHEGESEDRPRRARRRRHVAAEFAALATAIGTRAAGSSCRARPPPGPTTASSAQRNQARRLSRSSTTRTSCGTTRTSRPISSRCRTCSNFIRGNGTLLTNDHTVLISHTANGILTNLTGMYSDRHGQAVSNSYRYFTADGTDRRLVVVVQVLDRPRRTTSEHAARLDANYNMVNGDSGTPKNTPAPWVPYTRAGCDWRRHGARQRRAREHGHRPRPAT